MAEPTVAIDLPHLVDTGAVCSACLQHNIELLRCSACLHAWYCNRDCQAKHHPEHKSFCKALKMFNYLNKSLPDRLLPTTAHQFYLQRTNSWQALEALLCRPLTRRECRAILAEAKCSVCFRTREQLKEDVTLRNCPECLWGWACSEHAAEYAGAHGQWCPQYRLMNQAELLMNEWVIKNGKLPSWVPQGQRDSVQDFPTQGWQRYGRWRPAPMQAADPMFAVLSEKLSQPLTVMLGLVQHYSLQALSVLTELVVHVVGAGSYEVPADPAWEELLHMLPGVKLLHVAFIGPELQQIMVKEDDGKVGMRKVCDVCGKAGRTRHHSHHHVAYHEFIARRGSAEPPPTIVVAFNSGMSEQDRDSWQQSLKVLVEANATLVCTCYNKTEAEEPGAIDTFYYHNYYWFCAKGKATGHGFDAVAEASAELVGAC